MTDTRLTALSVESLRWWYPAFSRPGDPVVHLGENPQRPAVSVEQVLALAGDYEIQVLSSHESLRRDLTFAGHLRAAGAAVRCQSALATAAAADKMLVKRLLDRTGLPTPRWGRGTPPAAIASQALVKRQDGTQSQGLAWAAAAVTDHKDDRYWEQYFDGVEYSVVLHREDGRTVAFPPVWKGATRRDLLPPWRRLRVCPIPLPEANFTDSLIELATRTADILDVWGFAEVEFIVAGGTPYLIEVNPRVSGTLRLVAMATGVPVFHPGVLSAVDPRPPTTGYAAELPYAGTPLLTPDVIATSRITCLGITPAEARRSLERHAAPSIVAATWWPAGWDRVD